jgi:hypothetical protein
VCSSDLVGRFDEADTGGLDAVALDADVRSMAVP